MRREDEAEEAEEEVILEPKDKLEEQGEGSDTSSISDIFSIIFKVDIEIEALLEL